MSAVSSDAYLRTHITTRGAAGDSTDATANGDLTGLNNPRNEAASIEAIRAALLRGDTTVAQVLLDQSLAAFPHELDLRRIQAHVLQRTGRDRAAEAAYRALLNDTPGDVASAFALARMLASEGRTSNAANIMRACFAQVPNRQNPSLAINAIELLDDCGRTADAVTIAFDAIAANPDDARLYAYAGALEVQVGEFEQARQHYLLALKKDNRAWGWRVPIGLSSAQRYVDATHPDFTLFKSGLARPNLPESARAELHFALAKAHDDVGAYAEAAAQLRHANAIQHNLSGWSCKAWRRAAQGRLAAKPVHLAATPTQGFTPVFIVGMPRTGTTLLAEHLSGYPGVCNRGELPWLARLAERTTLDNVLPKREALEAAARKYAVLARQDDATGMRWFIDKQPLNFRYVDLALAMFPDARIIRCTRSARDTALSLWMQFFLGDTQGYSYDFDEIALVMRDEQRLMAHWAERYPGSVRTVHYGDLVSNADGTLTSLAHWIGLSSKAPHTTRQGPAAAINTASLWQARQPIYTHSIGRWHNYAPHIPDLMRFPA